MKVTQVYSLVNDITKEVLGIESVLLEDLSNTVDAGNQIFGAAAVDNYVKSLVNHIGKVVFVNRPYSGNMPSLLMDSWEFGSVCEKITAELPEAEENESWNLTDGSEYNPNIFHQPKVSAKFFNSRITFEIPMSFTEKQVRESFSSANQLNAFFSMIEAAIDKSLTIKIDGLCSRTVNNMIGLTLSDCFSSGDTKKTYPTDLSEKTSIRAVNLLYEYKQATGDSTLTKDNCLTNLEFLKFASMKIALVSNRITKISTLFNGGGKDRFTSEDMQRLYLLNDFVKSSEMYLQANTFHNSLVELSGFSAVPYWQSSGKSFTFNDISSINVKTTSGDTINQSGIIGVLFDRDACAVANMDRRVTSAYNPKGEFFNNFYKYDAGYFCDNNENFVVFFIA